MTQNSFGTHLATINQSQSAPAPSFTGISGTRPLEQSPVVGEAFGSYV